MNYGLPRNDILVNGSDKIKHIKKSLNIVDEKILLYAPTFRRDSTTELFNADLIHVKEKLEKITKFKWKVLLRLHPFISDFSNDVLKDKSVIDVTNYMDLSELLLITDYLISDYSSLMFDYAITFKPVQIYAPDFDKYISNDGITLEKDEIPFFISRDNKELLNNIEKFDEEYYIKTLKEFFKNQGLNETGKASEKIVELIDDITEEGK